jgi:predicted glycosyltransferase
MTKQELNKKYYDLAAELDDVRKQLREVEQEEEAQEKAHLVGKFFKESGAHTPETFMRVLDFSEDVYPLFEIVIFNFDTKGWCITTQDVSLLDWVEISESEYIGHATGFLNVVKHDLLYGLK